MPNFFSPYDADRPLMMRCSCGRDHSAADHHAEVSADAAAVELRRRSLTDEFEAYSNEFLEATLVKALFPQDAVRRRFGAGEDQDPRRLARLGRQHQAGIHRAAIHYDRTGTTITDIAAQLGTG